MGDLIHTLPAVTDAVSQLPGIRFDWVAEDVFAEIPGWHPAVCQVIPVAIRRWRRSWSKAWLGREIQNAIGQLKSRTYDRVIDAQGLIKSAIITRLAQGTLCGMDRLSCREPLASIAYQKRFHIPKGVHAIDRVRELFAKTLEYDLPECIDYGLNRDSFNFSGNLPYLVFLHGTSWPTKLLPQLDWITLASLARGAGFSVYLPCGSIEERSRAEEIASGHERVHVLPPMNLTQIAGVLAQARGVIGVDTGLSHLAAALDIPGLTLYRATHPELTGTRGQQQTCMISGTLCGSERQSTREKSVTGLNVVERETLEAEGIWRYFSDHVISK